MVGIELRSLCLPVKQFSLSLFPSPISQNSPDAVYSCLLGLLGLTPSLEVARVFVTPGPLFPAESPPSKLLAVIASRENAPSFCSSPSQGWLMGESQVSLAADSDHTSCCCALDRNHASTWKIRPCSNLPLMAFCLVLPLSHLLICLVYSPLISWLHYITSYNI